MSGRPDSERLARLALAALVEAGSWPVFDAVREHGAEEVLAALRRGRPVGAVSAAAAAGAAARSERLDVEGDLARLRAAGGRLVTPADPEWPGPRLVWSPAQHLDAPPLSLQVLGPHRLDEAVERSVAVVGARAATAYGAQVAGELALRVAERGFSVVSGGAYGIDGAAHRGALAAAGAPTVAVLACGVDVAYPRGNDRMLARIGETGLLVAEQVAGSSPTRGRFLVRNRLIAALTLGTVVVEAALRSGSLSTARRAVDLHRHVMAVPGPVTSALSAGCHELLRGEGQLVTDAADVLALVGPIEPGAVPVRRGPERSRDELSELVRRVLDAVPVRGGAGEAALARDAGVPVLTVQQVMPPLLVAGLVQRCDTGWRLTALGAQRPEPRRAPRPARPPRATASAGPTGAA